MNSEFDKPKTRIEEEAERVYYREQERLRDERNRREREEASKKPMREWDCVI